jgi:hypothetical protein
MRKEKPRRRRGFFFCEKPGRGGRKPGLSQRIKADCGQPMKTLGGVRQWPADNKFNSRLDWMFLASTSVGALLVLSFRPKSRGWLFWKSGDAYSSWWMVTKSSSPVTRASCTIAGGLIIRSSLSDGAPTRTTMRWSLKLGKPLTIRRANSGGSEHPSPTSP